MSANVRHGGWRHARIAGGSWFGPDAALGVSRVGGGRQWLLAPDDANCAHCPHPIVAKVLMEASNGPGVESHRLLYEKRCAKARRSTNAVRQRTWTYLESTGWSCGPVMPFGGCNSGRASQWPAAAKMGWRRRSAARFRAGDGSVAGAVTACITIAVANRWKSPETVSPFCSPVAWYSCGRRRVLDGRGADPNSSSSRTKG